MKHYLLPGICGLLLACSQQQPPVSTAIAPVAPNPASDSTKPAAKSVESLTIAFPEASTTLSSEALSQLDGAARLYRSAQPEVMFVSGHSDPTGDEFGNIVLSARRALKTKAALVDRGIPADKLQVVAVGSAQPIPTVPAVPSAVITWR
jgi:outer membrane protein OmpA-like peptidoglycan-associated protein